MFRTTIDKEEVETLPGFHFEGKIITINTEGQAERIAQFLLTQKVLGFDTETRPSFRKGSNNKVALLQISTADEAFLFRLGATGLPEKLKQVREKQEAIKQEIKNEQKIQSTFTKEITNVQNSISLLNNEIEEKELVIEEIETQITLVGDKVLNLEKSIVATEAEIEKVNVELKNRFVDIYLNEKSSSKLNFIFSNGGGDIIKYDLYPKLLNFSTASIDISPLLSFDKTSIAIIGDSFFKKSSPPSIAIFSPPSMSIFITVG